MSALLAEIQDAVRKNLPAHLSEELRSLLTKAEQTEKANEALSKEVTRLQKQRDEAEAANKLWKDLRADLDTRQTNVDQREKALKVREDKIAVLELEVKLRTEFNHTLRDVVKDVFSNNRFKYTESYPVTQQSNCGGNISTYSQQETRSGEGEGLTAAPGPVIK